jgi:hypothetical protein
MVIYLLGLGHNTKNGKNTAVYFFQCYMFFFKHLIISKNFIESSLSCLSNEYYRLRKISDIPWKNSKTKKKNFLKDLYKADFGV